MKHKPTALFYYICILCGIVAAFYFCDNSQWMAPEQLLLTPGQKANINMDLPVWATVRTADQSEIYINGEKTNCAKVNLNESWEVYTDDSLDTELIVQVLDIFTVEKIPLHSQQNADIIPGGQSIGIAVYLQGALVHSTGSFINEQGKSVSPAQEAGLQKGDRILFLNGQQVEGAAHLLELINQTGEEPVTMTVERNSVQRSIEITPQKDGTDGKYHLGLWVRDSTAGIGTLTFIDKETGVYGSLGHAISDSSGGKELQVRTGGIISAKIIDVVKGQIGTPGELCGIFMTQLEELGDIQENCEFGIYGNIHDIDEVMQGTEAISMASQYEIVTGPATILSTIDEEGVKAYSCTIERISYQKTPSVKGLIVRITDERLLEKTGGIVQGMSGSPIIQNGKWIGAVTHVFVNDPTRGYGVFAEWMIQCAEELENAS